MLQLPGVMKASLPLSTPLIDVISLRKFLSSDNFPSPMTTSILLYSSTGTLFELENTDECLR